jgi:hypothetical protein
MEPYFEEIYNFYEDIEEKKEKMFAKLSKGKLNNSISTYSSYTRQSCNFIFPNISEKINGEKRPRPSHFNIKEDDIYIVLHNKEKELISKLKEIDDYLYNSTEFENYKYMPILRKDEYGGYYIKCKLLLDKDTNNILTNYKIQDTFTDEIFEDNLNSINELKKQTKNVKELVIFPNKLWTSKSENTFGISLRIKDIMITK